MRQSCTGRPLGVLFVLIAVLMVAGVAWTARPVAAQPVIQLQPIITGLLDPLGIVSAGDSRLFIVLQEGRIVIWDGTGILPTDFLNVRSLVTCCGERGLLGLAFHPNYPSTPYFYVYYTNTAGNSVVARYQVSADPNVADTNPLNIQIILTVTQPAFTNHKGGQLNFGPDGYLYIALGDGGSGGDPDNHAQNLGDLLGKILRIDVDSASPYAIPATNPFVGRPGLDEIWAYGLRNPWRFAFDRLTGDMFIADVGQGAWEEVNFQPAGSPGGQNYGWRLMEGAHCFPPGTTGCESPSLTLPILEYDHGQGCSITGGYRYRGSAHPAMVGFYFYGDFCSGRIWGAAPSGGGAWTTTMLLDSSLNISTFGEDAAGELYVADLKGTIYRIITPPAGEIILDNAAAGASDGSRTFTGTWCPSGGSGSFGADSVFSCGAGLDTYRWTPTMPAAGTFDVYVWWSSHPNRSTTVPITVTHAAGSTTQMFNEQNPGGTWVLHGRYSFNAGTGGFVQVSDVNGQAAADAVRFVPVAGSEIIVDNLPAGAQDAARTFTGTWCPSGGSGSFGADSLYSCGAGLDTYRWTPTMPAAGTFDVYVWWSSHPNRSTTVPITVTHAAGSTTQMFNEQTPGGTWVLHGRYSFNAGTGGFVQVSDVNGQAAADAVRFVPVR